MGGWISFIFFVIYFYCNFLLLKYLCKLTSVQAPLRFINVQGN